MGMARCIDAADDDGKEEALDAPASPADAAAAVEMLHGEPAFVRTAGLKVHRSKK